MNTHERRRRIAELQDPYFQDMYRKYPSAIEHKEDGKLKRKLQKKAFMWLFGYKQRKIIAIAMQDAETAFTRMAKEEMTDARYTDRVENEKAEFARVREFVEDTIDEEYLY